jgi:hypothetical protein
MAGAELDVDLAGSDDARDLATAAPEIAATVESLLARVRAGELATAPDEPVEAARVSWL